MMSCSVVVVVVVAALAVKNGQALVGFPQMGGIYGSQYGFQQQQQLVEPLMTCISINPQDPMSQLRLTIRPDRLTSTRPGYPFGGGFGDSFGDDLNEPQDWMVEGVITPGSMPRQGTYYAVVTQFGRTVGGSCHSAALGPAIQGSHHGKMGGFKSPFSPWGAMGGNFMGGFGGFGGAGGRFMGGMGGMGGNFMGGGMGLGGGMGSFFGQQQQQQQQFQPAGVLSNRVILTSGVSSYTARLRGVSFNNINGGGIALCPQLNQGQCIGSIPLCCSITRDQVSATQTILRPGVSGGGSLGLQGNGFMPNQNGFGGGFGGGGMGGFGGVGGTPGVFINSESFFDDDDNDFFENTNNGRLEGLF